MFLLSHRHWRTLALPLLLARDPAIAAGMVGLTAIWALAVVESWAIRDGLAVAQRFGLAAALLVVWLVVFRLQPLVAASAHEYPAWPAAGALVVIAAATSFIPRQAQGQPWGVLATAAASYLALFGAAVLRRQSGGWGLALLVLLEVMLASVAYLLVPAPLATAAVALGTAFVLLLVLAGRFLFPLPRPCAELADLLLCLRPLLPALALAAAASVLLSLVISGQPAALGRLMIPLVGIAASRLVAEEVVLRGWLLPYLERRFGSVLALVVTALASGAIAATAQVPGGSPAAPAALALAAALAAGVLAQRQRNLPAVVLFRLTVS
jgi:membrane protease YdiL (CAAX protease family)